ncbi:MAG TPA: UDP-N-acetylmuramoyl-tripeptide--D-alanyl-D-alanine ligase [Steroidobacteraceae bacterium]|nr:UDP-N-acetylmuramoyl-tripeptide--D-alanyl-D-alanine ligase [Steroidobacteraceae bacterium]
MKGRLSDVVAAAGGRLAGEDAGFAGVSTDSRSIERGMLFVALRGERFDGHEYVGGAAARGAAAAVVSRAVDVALPQAVVGDTLAALAAMASAWRARSGALVLGVGGSNGKTTTKEMLAGILAGVGATLATRGNLNNHIGVPLTLLRLEPGHRYAVVEMGANHPGEIAALATLAKPAIALVTNAGDEHLEGFGDLEGVARAEGEMYAALGDGGTAVVNADDPFAALWESMAPAGAKVLRFGIDAPADVRAASIQGRIEAGAFTTTFTLAIAGDEARVHLGLAGRHNVSNALGAAAAAHAAGIGIDDIAGGLGRMRPVAGRLQLKPGPRGSWLIDDSYNANPSSVRAGIDVLCALPGEHWLVLGEMAELGDETVASHAGVGDYARRAGVSRLFAMGAAARHATDAFGARAMWYADAASLGNALAASLERGVTALVKGSRINRLERVIERLVPPLPAAGNGN